MQGFLAAEAMMVAHSSRHARIAMPMVGAILLVLGTSTAVAETTIGRWCDRMIPSSPEYNRTMAIVVVNDGEVVLRSKFGDGSSDVRELREAAGYIYEVVGSRAGDKYSVVSSTGNLQLLDDDGLIRVATRLENFPTPGECAY